MPLRLTEKEASALGLAFTTRNGSVQNVPVQSVPVHQPIRLNMALLGIFLFIAGWLLGFAMGILS